MVDAGMEEVRWQGLARLLGEFRWRLARWAKGRLPDKARQCADTEDVVQEALAGAWKHRQQLDPGTPAAVMKYLQRSVRNRILDEVRKSTLETRVVGDAASNLPSENPDRLFIERDAKRKFRDALLRLAYDEQQLVIGRVEMGLGYRELAALTGKASPEAARSATRRALLKIARLL